jgi:adenylate cyclase
VVAALGVAIGVAIAWLLSHINQSTYDHAEFENGARNGLTVAAMLVAFDLFYLHGPCGAWLRRLSFGRTVLIRAALLTVIIVLCFSLSRLIFGLIYGFERAGLEYFGLELLRDTVIAFVVCVTVSEFLQMRRVIGGRKLNNLLGRYWRPVREERVFMLVDIKGSTALAERFGDERVHAIVTSVFLRSRPADPRAWR